MLMCDGDGICVCGCRKCCWMIQQNPLPQENTLNGVWGSSGSDVFAVGKYGTILRYDGNEWSEMSFGTIKYLSGVWGSSGSDVFAVGQYGIILYRDAIAPMHPRHPNLPRVPTPAFPTRTASPTPPHPPFPEPEPRLTAR